MYIPKKQLGLKPLVQGFKNAFNKVNDTRRSYSVKYSILNAALSGLACMFYKSENMLRFQRTMEHRHHRSNLQTQFGVTEIPKDNQMRALVAEIEHKQFQSIYKDYFSRMQRGKQLWKFMFRGKYLVPIDATQYYRSECISCSECLTRTKRNGKIEYSHKALQPIICHPNQKQILPMMPEPIRNTDGTTKQDCEVNAAKRLLPKIRAQHPRMDFIWLGDSLFATEPFIQAILDKHEEFIFRVKKGDHKSLFDELETVAYQSHRVEQKKSTIAYRFYENISLNKGANIKLNAFKAFVIMTDKEGKKKSTLVGTWITNIELKKDNIVSVTQAARSRWKIENECFNHVKNHGFALTHNWGHVNGEAFNFYNLIMLAFFIHQILKMTDLLFQKCRKAGDTYKDLWIALRHYFNLQLFNSWEEMLHRYLHDYYPSPP